MNKLTDGFIMGNTAIEELKKIRKSLAIKNLLCLIDIRHQLWKDSKVTMNGVEMDDEELYSMIEDLWDVTITDAQS